METGLADWDSYGVSWRVETYFDLRYVDPAYVL